MSHSSMRIVVSAADKLSLRHAFTHIFGTIDHSQFECGLFVTSVTLLWPLARELRARSALRAASHA